MHNKAEVGRSSTAGEAGFVNEKDSNLRGNPNENDSNLRGIPSEITMQKPDSYYLQEINKISCSDSDKIVQDNTHNTYEQDNFYCYSNGPTKKLVQWKKVDGLWLGRHLTNSSEYKEINNNVCKVITPGCDSYNPSQGCVVKCFLDNKTTTEFTANYEVLPN